MKKQFLFLMATVVFSVFMCSFVYSQENEGLFKVNARSAILVEPSTGKVILEQNAHEKLPPASVTKIMTMLLIYDAIDQGRISLSDMVSVSEHASSMGGSQVFLEPNEQQSVETMLKCIAIASANDAAVAMAEFIGGSEESFVNMMNQKAKELGMNDTHFVNACGLDADGHLTSAFDISLMSRELITKYPKILEYTKIWQDSLIHSTRRGDEEFGLTNTNKLLKWYQGATGLKTGSTGKALYCLSGTAEKNGMHLIGVVLAAPDYKVRFQEVMKMFDYGFANYGLQKGEPAGKIVGDVVVYKGDVNAVDAAIKDEVNVLLKKGKDVTLENTIELYPSISAPAKTGTKVGEIIYSYAGQELGRSDLVTTTDINRASIKDMFFRIINQWL